LVDQTLQLAALDQAAADLVEPDARARRGERREPLVHSHCHAHALSSFWVLLTAASPGAVQYGPAELDQLLGSYAEVLVHVLGGAGLAERGHAEERAVGTDPAVPAERHGRLHRHPRAHR